ncbi:MAG: DUF58 domain-containing protein [Pseudonocardia sp.]|nr:DUF58 domain-containing protein [Pseudonocardia sp.]
MAGHPGARRTIPGPRRARLSGLTTRGRCLVAGGLATAACGLVLDERDLLRIGLFVGLLPVLAVLFAARVRRVMDLARVIDPARLPVGAEATVGLALHGPALVGALRLIDNVPDAAGPDPAAPPRFTVHRLSIRGRADLHYPVRPVVRGVHRIGPLTATITDPLALAEFERELAGATTLLALPRTCALRGLPRAGGAGEGTPGASLAHQGQGTSDVVVRPYRYGDELRRVHWRSSARHDDLMVRLEERPWRGGMTVLLDRRDEAHRGRGADSSLEYAVSLAASVCRHLIARGEPVTLVTEDGVEVLGGHAVGEASTGGHVTAMDPLLDALAALRASARTDLVGPAFDRTGDVVAVLGAIGTGQLDAFLARRASGGHAILLDAATWDPASGRAGSAADAATVLRRSGWRVAIARAGDRIDRVWDDLVAGGRSA